MHAWNTVALPIATQIITEFEARGEPPGPTRMSAYERLGAAASLVKVGMDDMKLLIQGSGMRAIGTAGLNGCTCVVFLGATAILFAHIAPYDGQSTEDDSRNIHQASQDHHDRWLRAALATLRQNSDHFPPASTAWGIFSCMERPGQTPYTDERIRRQVLGYLQATGYSVQQAFYREIDAGQVVPPKGEIVAMFNPGAELYIEDKKFWPRSQGQSSSSGTTAGPSSASTQSDTQNASAKLWWNYPVGVDKNGHQTLTCVIQGKRVVLNAMWKGDPAPQLYMLAEYRQTRVSGSLLEVDIQGKAFQLERPQ
ncbi:hypothetical protein LTR37_019427 [Vermiconidia calcicola]|uniref:Uncharacterized protein n=1 Tax=Vermiconidia calcicola TaxID=1690605 RepID=A0ACC3MED7_9PEZI|nr:hypothetical protein LTR37_019427 [Vermiconidia calcicola]